jgi:toxin-antitoxin system PIN domain toxin
MILIDVNLLLYAYNASSEHHQDARNWLEHVFSGSEPAGLAWITILAFLRIATNTRAFDFPLTIAEAAAIVSEWLTRPMVTIVEPGPRHWEILNGLLSKAQARGPLVMDAHLAALALEHGFIVCSNDRDFALFPGVRVTNPLEAKPD